MGDAGIRKYLERHAVPEASLASPLLGCFAERVVVPAYAEGADLLDTLASIAPSSRGEVLIVLVQNHRVDSGSADIERTALGTSAVSETYAIRRSLSAHVVEHAHPAGRIVRIERTGDFALPAKQGVGLARKVGLDFALATARDEAEWLHTTDADARVPRDYFAARDLDDDVVAGLYPFTHRADPSVGESIFEYEAHLRLLVLGLREAGSEFAHHSIGSTIAVRARAYAAVRGMPRRQAAEDFHFLAKVRKLGPVRTVRCEPMVLSGRRSHRVPFGTGRSMSDGTGFSVAHTYDPTCFRELGFGLAALATATSASSFRDALAGHELVHDAMISERVGVTLAHAARHSPSARAFHLRAGFDALRTLRVIHRLRDAGLENVPLRDAVRDAPWIDVDPTLPPESLARALATAEREANADGESNRPCPRPETG